MGGFFDFSLLDVWNNPIMRILRWGVKTTAKGITSASAKEENERAAPSEFLGLCDRALNGDSDAQFMLGKHCIETKEYEKAKHWLIKSAEQGNEQAIGLLDLMQEE